MARVVVTEAALRDEAGIVAELLTKAGYRVAEKYKVLFDRVYRLLTDHPAVGPVRPQLGSHVRIWIVAPYVLIYELSESEDVVTVLRIVHGRRKIAGSLLSTV
jgi:plasmid stabilization system protein ParE